ncbi:MAG: septal ring lytic transglycosylase RlpA family protein [Siculibacillus sp.]
MIPTNELAASRRGGAVRSAILACAVLVAGGSLAEAAEGIASFYGRKEHGGPTASGERFNMNAMTAAHRTLPLGSRVTVTNLRNGRSVTVRINDRGPFVKGRIIDLSHAAANELGFVASGLTTVRIDAAGPNAATRLASVEPETTGTLAPTRAPRSRALAAETALRATPVESPADADAAPPSRLHLTERDRLMIDRNTSIN